jgi:hypothetical protein
MKTVLNALGTKLLILKRGELLSSFAFNFNLRRCIPSLFPAVIDLISPLRLAALAGWCSLTVSRPMLKAPVVSALEAKI